MKNIRPLLIWILSFVYGYGIAQRENYKDSLDFYYERGIFKQAEMFGEKLVEKTKKTSQNSLAYVTAVHSLATVYQALGKFQSADTLMNIGLSIQKIKLGENNEEFANTLVDMGDLYGEMGNFDNAEQCESKALKIYKDLKLETKQFCTLLNNIGLHKQNVSNFGLAKEYYLQALEMYEKNFGKNGSLYPIILNNIGVLEYKLSHYREAEHYFTESLELKRKGNPQNMADIAYSLGNLSSLYTKIGNFAAAEPLVIEVIKIRKSTIGELHPEYAASLNNYANILQARKKYKEADSLYGVSLKILKSSISENHPYYIASLTNLATTSGKHGNVTLADSLFKQIISICKRAFGDTALQYAQANRNLGRLYYFMGNYTASLPLLLKTVNDSKKILGETSPDIIISEVYLSQLLVAINCSKDADSFTQSALNLEDKFLIDKSDFLSETELIAYLDEERKQTFDLPFSVLLHYNSIKLIEAAYNSRLLINGISIQNTSNLSKQMEQEKDSLLFAKWKTYKGNKYLLNKTLSQPIVKRTINTDSLNELTNQQEKDLLRQSATYRDMKTKLNTTWQDVHNSLRQNETAIEFVKFNNLKRSYSSADTTYYAAMLLRPQDTVPVFVKLFEESQLKTALKHFVYTAPAQFRGSGGIKTSALITKTAQNNCYNLVWKPLEKYLANTKTVYFSPDGLLNQISFAAIPYKKDSLLCDKYNLVQVTSTRQVAIQQASTKTPSSIALFGGINYNRQQTDTGTAASTDPFQYVYQQNRSAGLDSFNYLPHTLTEIEGINTTMKANKKTVVSFAGDKATEAAFRSISGPASPQVIHIATHGFTLPDDTSKSRVADNVFKLSNNPLLRSGLVMAGGNKGWKGIAAANEDDGILTALEISAIPLQNTELVVLSACETGLGELRGSEGVFGLQRAFKLAGVNYIMASLWAVPDKETGIFMNQFYTNWLASGNIQQAFVATQRGMQQKKYSPYYWAGFTLVH